MKNQDNKTLLRLILALEVLILLSIYLMIFVF